MSTAQAGTSEAARALARSRWGDRVVRRSAATVLDRVPGLTDTTRAELEQIAGDPARDGDDAR